MQDDSSLKRTSLMKRRKMPRDLRGTISHDVGEGRKRRILDREE